MKKTELKKAKTESFDTERLTLRLMTEEEWQIFVDHIIEADEFYDMFACDMTEQNIVTVRGLFIGRKTVGYSVHLHDTDEMIGYVEFCTDEKSRDYNHIAYCIFKEYRRKGYASEAAGEFIRKLLADEILDRTIDEIRAWIVWGNLASSYVLGKLGFRSYGFRVYDSGLIEQCFVYVPEGTEEIA